MPVIQILTALNRQDHDRVVRATKKGVLEILFPEVRAKVFRLLFTPPYREHYVREMMLRTNLALRTVQDELGKLSAVGLITSRSNGFRRFYQANPKHPLSAQIRRIVEVSSGLPETASTALYRVRKRRLPGKRSHLRREPAINWGTLKRKS